MMDEEVSNILLNQWLNEDLPEVTKALENINENHFFKERTIGLREKKVYIKSSSISVPLCFPESMKNIRLMNRGSIF